MPTVEVEETVRIGTIDGGRPDAEGTHVTGSEPERIPGVRILRVAPGEQGDCSLRRRQELARDLLREAGLVRVADGARADPAHGRHDRKREQDDEDRADRDADPRPVSAPPAETAARRPPVEATAAGARRRGGGGRG